MRMVSTAAGVESIIGGRRHVIVLFRGEPRDHLVAARTLDERLRCPARLDRHAGLRVLFKD